MLSKIKNVITSNASTSNNSSSAEAQETVSPPKIGMVVDMAGESNVFAEIISVMSGGPSPSETHPQYSYTRPEFLHFSKEETQLSADQLIRPVLCPKYALPVNAGYAEVINHGKSVENEDMATAKILNIVQQGYEPEKAIDLVKALKRTSTQNSDIKFELLGNPFGQIKIKENPRKLEKRRSDEDILTLHKSFSSDDEPTAPRAEAAYFAIFDGHAGSGAAIMASKMLHEHIKNRLSEVLESILHLHRQETLFNSKNTSKNERNCWNEDPTLEKNYQGEHRDKSVITADSLIVGALEAAFVEMDDRIGAEKAVSRLPGGCAAIVVLFFLNKIYVANAGDCRALLVSPNKYLQLSTDFSPLKERKRLQTIAYRNREVISNCFSRQEYSRFLTRKDLNHKVLYRDWYMDGWAAKTVREADLKPPLISTRCKKSRLLNTIGVSRGLGDHHLMTVDDRIAIKPFLSAHPEVQVFDTRSMDCLSSSDVLVVGSDGLWDVFSNEDVFNIVNTSMSTLNSCESTGTESIDLEDDSIKYTYTLMAQELAAGARGDPVDNSKWRLSGGAMASSDDITVFVIPLKFAVNLCAEDSTEDDDEELLVA
uniref:PPM-type phosphatase domain-containing protein n=1 Tax=Ditylenchus dipsaci TaxID=166011 RepID=A0A915ED07_9BILA